MNGNKTMKTIDKTIRKTTNSYNEKKNIIKTDLIRERKEQELYTIKNNNKNDNTQLNTELIPTQVILG